MVPGRLERRAEEARRVGGVRAVRARGRPLVADGEGAIDDLADEGFAVGGYGYDDGLGDGLR